MAFSKELQDFFNENGVNISEQYKQVGSIQPAETGKNTPTTNFGKTSAGNNLNKLDNTGLVDQEAYIEQMQKGEFTVESNSDGLLKYGNTSGIETINSKVIRVNKPIPIENNTAPTNVNEAKSLADSYNENIKKEITLNRTANNITEEQRFKGDLFTSANAPGSGKNPIAEAKQAEASLASHSEDIIAYTDTSGRIILKQKSRDANDKSVDTLQQDMSLQSSTVTPELIKAQNKAFLGEVTVEYSNESRSKNAQNKNIIANTNTLSKIHQRLKNHGEETHTVFKDFEDNGLLLLYVPKDTQNLYIAKSYKTTDVPDNKPGSTANVRTSVNSELLGRRGERTDVREIMSTNNNGQDNVSMTNIFSKADRNASSEPSKEDSGKINLYMQFSEFSLPEVLRFGKKATGQTIEIPGGRRQTQVTGVYPLTMSFEVVLVDLFAADNAAQLELFTGQRAILWFQETGTKLNYTSSSKKGEEVKTHAWFGTVMNVEFDYYHRNYIVARITYEPSKDIGKLRINDHDRTKTSISQDFRVDASDLINSIEKIAKNNPIPSFIGRENDGKLITKGFPQRKLQTAAESARSSAGRTIYEANVNALNAAAMKNTVTDMSTAAQIKSVLEKIAFNNNSFGVFDDALKWLNQNYVQYISQANDFIKNCLNYTRKINNLIPEALSFIDTALTPLTDITNTMFALIKNSAGALDVAKLPYNILKGMQNKFEAAKKGYEDTLNYVSTKFTDVYKGVTSYFDKKPEEKKSNISAPELTRLINSMNTYANIPYIPSKFVTDIKNTIKNLEKAGVRDISDLRMNTIQVGLFQDLIIPINVKELAMKKVIAQQEEVKKQKRAALELKYGKKMSDMEAQILFAKELIESTPENNNVSVSVIATNALKDLVKKQNPSPSDVKFITEVDIRATLIRIMAGTKPNPSVAISATNLANETSAIWKTLPTPVIVNKAYMITEQDITLGYNGIAGKFYFNPLLGARLEKYNNMKKLELGASIIIPTNYILERFDYVPEQFDGTKIRFAISYIITSADVIGGYALIAANFYSDPLLGIRLQKYNSMKVLVEGDLITIPPLSILKTFDLIS